MNKVVKDREATWDGVKVQVLKLNGSDVDGEPGFYTCRVLEDKKPYKVDDLVDLYKWEIKFSWNSSNQNKNNI